MTTVEENLARVRADLADQDADDALHSRILSDYSAAIRDHEHELREQRHKLHRKRRRKDDNRFRFKETRDPHARKTRSKADGHAPPREDEVEQFTSHPLPRPPKDPLLDGKEKSGPAADPDVAFATSLFDALADDEGAARYWEAVYSQPLHIYERPRAGADGSLEAMTDAEYAEYVKRRMWERLHPEEAREVAAREEAKERGKQKEQERKRAPRSREARTDNDPLGVQAALDRGEARKRARHWTQAWQAYQKRWGDDLTVETMPWPTSDGSAPNEGSDTVRTFFEGVTEHALPSLVGEEKGEIAGAKRLLLKTERFRWHPDKMLQRFGGELQARPETLAKVTGVFQVVDAMMGKE